MKNNKVQISIFEQFEKYWTPVPWSGCFLWTGRLQFNGYGQIYIRGRVFSAHRCSYMLYVGPIPSGKLVLHRCDVRSCVNPDHLFIGAARDNTADMIAKGRADWSRPVKGESHWKAVLTKDDVYAIRAEHRKTSLIAASYNISMTHVRRIRKKQCWMHV